MLDYLWYQVYSARKEFTLKELANIRSVLLAFGPPNKNDEPTFTKQEIDTFFTEKLCNRQIVIVSAEGRYLNV